AVLLGDDVADHRGDLGLAPARELRRDRHQRDEVRAAIADGHDLGDARIALDEVLDVLRRDVLAPPADDQALLPVPDVVESVAVAPADSAGAEEPGGGE